MSICHSPLEISEKKEQMRISGKEVQLGVKRSGNVSVMHIVLALISGFLLTLSFPPFWTGFLAHLGLVPLLVAIDGRDPRQAFLLGFVSGIAFNLGTLYWISWITLIGTFAAAFVLAIYMGVFCLLSALILRTFGYKGVGVIPFVWTAIEYLMSFGDLGFPWTALGNTQTYYLRLIQFADITSVHGVSFWIVTVNVVIFSLIANMYNKRRVILLLCTVAALFVLPYIYGVVRIPDDVTEKEEGRGIRIAIVQPNIPPEVKWGLNGRDRSFEILGQMTIEAASQNPDLIIWPETATPCYIRSNGKYRNIVHFLSDSLGVPILTGAPDYEPEKEESYNSAFLFQPDTKVLQGYNKIKLVPVSETTPFRGLLPFMGRIRWGNLGGSEWDESNFERGQELTLFSFAKGNFSTLICFESVFPDLVRDFVKRDASFLVNITNDAWFGKSSAPYQHAQISIFRAIENRIWIARCANAGVSLFIDPYGRKYKETLIFEPAMIVQNISPQKGETFFTEYGNVFSKTCVALSIMLVVYLLADSLKRSRRTKGEEALC